MLLKEGFILKKILDDYIVVPTGDNIVDFAAVVSLNETGAFLWKELESEKTAEQLVDSLMKEYEVSVEDASKDVAEFIDSLNAHNFLLE